MTSTQQRAELQRQIWQIANDESVKYATLGDDVITAEIKDDAIKTKGYFIYPSQLFANIAANAGKSGGEFFTPQHVSKLIAQLAMQNRPQSIKFMIQPLVRVHFYYKPKNTLTLTSLKTVFLVKKSTTLPITLPV